jgi:hypothetical protein
LYSRVLRLERARGVSPPVTPYGHLLGKSIEELIGSTFAAGQPRVLLFLSSGCGSCRRVLDEVASPSWTVPTALLWTDGAPATTARPAATIVIDDGPRISADMGIRVTPFGLVADETGRVVQAIPINSVRSLSHLNGSRPAITLDKQLSARGERKP